MSSLEFGTQIIVHLDLKGAPPKVCYLEKFFPLIRQFGATGVLIEWEDTFPYTKELTPIGGISYASQTLGSPYTLADAKLILELAADNGLTVIPLVQTFGHLEFILKHEQWSNLREVDAYPSSICPLKDGTMPLIQNLIKQIISFHCDSQYIHIGADEVWHMGICPECSRKALNAKYGKVSLFLDHIVTVVQYIKDNYPHIKVMMWDDMLRNINKNILEEHFVSNIIEPVIWHYNNRATFNLGSVLWENYNSVFSNIWGASAFKGAAGSCQQIPINRHYIENHEAWIAELGTNCDKVQSFRGMILTGWSRYDHYATLCELLPSSVPTLALCIKTWLAGKYNQELHDSVAKALGYTNPPLPLEPLIRPCVISAQLNYPGWTILVGVEWLENLRAKYRSVTESDQIMTWFNHWQIRNNYTNPMQIESILHILTNLLGEISSVENYLKLNLDTLFYPSTTEELIGTWIVPMKERIQQLKTDCEKQLAIGSRARCFIKT